MKLNKIIAGLAVWASVVSFAEEPTTTTATPDSTVSAAVAAPSPDAGKVIGIVDLRPSVLVGSGTYYSENSIELGYKFNSKYSLTYVQFLNTNIFTPGNDETKGVDVTLPGAFIRGRIANLAKLGEVGVSYQNRTYLPLTQADRDKGRILSMRNYFNFNFKLSEKVNITLTEMPVLHAFTKSGAGNAANPGFENRVYFTPEIKLTDKLVLYLPVLFHQTRYRNYQAGATNNDAWGFFLWVNPEIYYSVNDNFTVGLGYYSDNLAKGDLSALTLSEGLDAGVFQASLSVNL